MPLPGKRSLLSRIAPGLALWSALAGTVVLGISLGLARAAGCDAGTTSSPDAATPDAASEASSEASSGESQTCLSGLRDRGVDFVEQPTKGVRTPIRLLHPTLGALRLVWRDQRNRTAMPVMDCELARALLDATPTFQAAGIRDLSFSGTYEYRTQRHSSKLSEHAHGLAIDVHQFGTIDGKVFDVQHDFESGVGDWSSRDPVACVGSPERPVARLLRELACALRASSAFREIITPDDNADHENHFHIEAFPDPLTRARSLLQHREPVSDD
jgi:hypothetical protein